MSHHSVLSVRLSRGTILLALIGFTLFRTSTVLAQETLVVDNDPVWGPNPQLVEEFRIGDAELGIEYMFSGISSVAVLSDGSILVADRQGPTLKKFDPTGRYISDIGGPGEGPGEYSAIGGVDVHFDNTIGLWDARNRRLTFFEADGAYLRSSTVNSGTFSSRTYQVDDRGYSYILSLDMSGDRQENGDFPRHYIKVSPEGESIGVVPIPPENRKNGYVLLRPDGRRGPFNDAVLSAVGKDGSLVVGDNRAYSIELRSDSAVNKRFEIPYEQIEVFSDERRQWTLIAESFIERSNRDRSTFPDIPDTKPAFRDLWIDADGRIWLQRYVVADRIAPNEDATGPSGMYQWHEKSVYDVLSADGLFLGSVELPPRNYLQYARGNRVWAELTDDDGAPWVVQYRIQM